MLKYFLLLLFTAQAVVAQSPKSNRPRPTPTPPPQTEVYATASDGTQLTWTVYTPAGSGPWPAVLVIHGGLFMGGDASEAE